MEDKLVYKILNNAVNGINAHVNPANVLEDLTITVAGKSVNNSPYTIWQVLKHVNYWQKKFISYIKDETTPRPSTAKEGWDFSAEPADEEELKEEIKYFSHSIDTMLNLSIEELNKRAQNYSTGFDVLQAMASHISYHFGEIVILRRIIGNWPPPSGGDTW